MDGPLVRYGSKPGFPFCLSGDERIHPRVPGSPPFSHSFQRQSPLTAPRVLCPGQKAVICLISKRFLRHPPSSPLRRPDWFRLAAAPIRPAAAKPESAAACLRTGAASDGSLPTTASSSGHALPTGRRLKQAPPATPPAPRPRGPVPARTVPLKPSLRSAPGTHKGIPRLQSLPGLIPHRLRRGCSFQAKPCFSPTETQLPVCQSTGPVPIPRSSANPSENLATSRLLRY